MKLSPSLAPAAFLLVALFTVAGLVAASPEAERIAIEPVIRASIGWALTKDTQLLYDSVAQDGDFFIFHPDSKSTILGFDAFRKMVEEVFMDGRFKATDFQVRELRIGLAKSNDVAWFSAYLDDHGEWNGRPSGWNDARWTGVLEKRAGKWVIVQMHFSLATDKVLAAAKSTAAKQE
jgi:hypothetical protein